MNSNQIQKITSFDKIQSKTPTYIALGGVFVLLWFFGFHPVFLLFAWIVGFFIYKAFEKPDIWEAKYIFDFYIAANEILRDSDRRWFGFEVQEVITQGERIIQKMPDPPPLLHFTLGALYNKIGCHKAAVEQLAFLVENESSDELKRSIASPELRNYVTALRRIESEPTEAPKSSAAVRALERSRRNRINAILEDSRKALWDLEAQKQAELANKNEESLLQGVIENVREEFIENDRKQNINHRKQEQGIVSEISSIVVSQVDKIINENKENQSKEKKKNYLTPRKPISEVLQDIYDSKQ